MCHRMMITHHVASHHIASSSAPTQARPRQGNAARHAAQDQRRHADGLRRRQVKAASDSFHFASTRCVQAFLCHYVLPGLLCHYVPPQGSLRREGTGLLYPCLMHQVQVHQASSSSRSARQTQKCYLLQQCRGSRLQGRGWLSGGLPPDEGELAFQHR